MLERTDGMFPYRSRPETVGPPLPHLNPHESASCSLPVDGPQTTAKASGYTAGQVGNRRQTYNAKSEQVGTVI